MISCIIAICRTHVHALCPMTIQIGMNERGQGMWHSRYLQLLFLLVCLRSLPTTSFLQQHRKTRKFQCQHSFPNAVPSYADIRNRRISINVKSSNAIKPLQDELETSLPLHESSLSNNTFDCTNWSSQLTEGLPPQNILLLNTVALIWGTQHPVIKMVVNDCDASAFSLVRFGLGALIATPMWLASTETSTQTWRWGLEMGMWMFLGYACQAIGLATTTALRSGFLLYLNVKFVPFFAFFLFGRQISVPTWISALVAFSGTALLAYDGSGVLLNTGDIWCIAAAAASAMFILRLETASKEVSNAAALNATCLWVVTAAALIWSLGSSAMTTSLNFAVSTTCTSMWTIIHSHPWEIVYLAGVTTAFANYIQTKAQRNVTAERASVIYAMDPVYGAFFSNLLLGETLSGIGVVGAALITLAAATNAFLDLGTMNKEGEK